MSKGSETFESFLRKDTGSTGDKLIDKGMMSKTLGIDYGRMVHQEKGKSPVQGLQGMTR